MFKFWSIKDLSICSYSFLKRNMLKFWSIKDLSICSYTVLKT